LGWCVQLGFREIAARALQAISGRRRLVIKGTTRGRRRQVAGFGGDGRAPAPLLVRGKQSGGRWDYVMAVQRDKQDASDASVTVEPPELRQEKRPAPDFGWIWLRCGAGAGGAGRAPSIPLTQLARPCHSPFTRRPVCFCLFDFFACCIPRAPPPLQRAAC
jgi:hypothetical protein